MLRFLHLSDVHFRKKSGNSYDVDTDLRNELEIDCKAFSEKHGAPDAILVTGDVAFSGSRDEYQIAAEWLRKLCELVSCSETAVWCVPGNHDVNQAITKASDMLSEAQEKIRRIATESPSGLNDHLNSLMSDPMQRNYLFAPIEEYNKFAAVFKCDVTPTSPVWHSLFTLADGTKIRLNGLTSTFVSNHFDQERQFVVVGEHQAPMRDHEVVEIVLCHHPHDWIRGDDFKAKLDARARLQLFGHKHMQAIKKLENTVHVVAGAVHPERSEQSWEPRFNWIELETANDGARELMIRVFPRKWNSTDAKFDADFNLCNGSDNKQITFPLQPLAQPAGGYEAQQAVLPVESMAKDVSPTNNENDEENARILTYRYLNLSHVRRLQVAIELGLLQDQDEGLADFKLYERVFERAIERDLLCQLWDKVDQLTKDSDGSVNPFVKTE
ncbi:MAG: metallophosphoesterase [Bdellovibrionales bacterium]|nr:metallophosphoesterase [Bdellovibrionales bacterium]